MNETRILDAILNDIASRLGTEPALVPILSKINELEKDRDFWKARWKRHQGVFKAIEDLNRK